jgi:hypothetical protein
MRINDTLRVEPIFDYKNGRRFQILVVNKEQGQNFTTHHDIMGREYIKLKLSEADIMQLIQELQRNITDPKNDPRILEGNFKKNRLKVVSNKEEEESDGNKRT